jgi:hypothetical protein
MKRLIVALLMLVAIASAQLIPVHFGDTQVDDLLVDSVTTLSDSVHVGGIVIGDGATLTFFDVALDAYLQFTAANETAEFYGDVLCDSQLTVLDTLAVGIVAPEYFVHIYDAGAYPALFEGDNAGATWVAVDNNHATAECGFSIWRAGTEMWTIEDSNGTFIIYDSDDTANRVSIDGTTGVMTVYQNVSAGSDLFVGDSLGVTGNATFSSNVEVIHDAYVGGDVYAGGYNFATAAMVGGTANDITIDFTPDLPTLTAGSRVSFIAEGLNTGATTLDVDGVGAVNVYENTDVSACEGGEIVDNMAVELMHDGTQWQIISNQP